MAYELYYEKPRRLVIKQNGKNSYDVYRAVQTFVEACCQKRLAYWISKYEFALAPQLFDVWYERFEAVTTFKQTRDFIHGIDTRVFPTFGNHAQHLDKLHITPYPYQKDGINFFLDRHQALLADEMGLGKTMQGFGAAHDLIQSGKVSKVLVATPSSVKGQFANEIEQFSDLHAIVVKGTKTNRKKIYEEFAANPDIHFLVGNYESFANDIEVIKTLPFQCAILDEIHKIKNEKTKLFKAFMQIQPEYRFGLSGTPLVNTPMELYNIFQWINPIVRDENNQVVPLLGTIQQFRRNYIMYGEKFGQNMELGFHHLDELRDEAAQFMLARKKKDVANDLPEKIIKNVTVELYPEQVKLYERIEEDRQYAEECITDQMMDTWKKNGANPAENPRNVLLGYQFLVRAISNDPLQLSESDSTLRFKYMDELSKQKRSAKTEAILELLSTYIGYGEQVIIFSQYTGYLDILEKRIKEKLHTTPYRIDGSTPADLRTQIVEESQSNRTKSPIMLVSDAANFGLSLHKGFSVLIQADMPWTNTTTEQRYGRIHRLGSTFKHVTFINMIATAPENKFTTIDEAIFKTQLAKKDVTGSII